MRRASLARPGAVQVAPPARPSTDVPMAVTTFAPQPAGDHQLALVVWLDGRDDLASITTAVEAAVRDVRVRTAADTEVGGWTRATLSLALARIGQQNGRVQAAAIRRALRRDGYVSRKEVCRLGGYAPDRTLRGFTRPPTRVVTAMKLAGEIPAYAIDLLATSYRSGSVQADGFAAPLELAALLDG